MRGSSSGRIGRRITGVPSFIVQGETYCTGYGRMAGLELSDTTIVVHTEPGVERGDLIDGGTQRIEVSLLDRGSSPRINSSPSELDTLRDKQPHAQLPRADEPRREPRRLDLPP